MTLYLVTKHDFYYPRPATWDWKFMGAEADARQFLAELEIDEYQTKCLIEISPKGWKVLEYTEIDGEPSPESHELESPDMESPR